MNWQPLAGETPWYVREFAEFASGLSPANVPDEALRAAARIFTDALSTTLIGHLDPEVARLGDEMLPMGGTPDATVLRAGFPKTDVGLASLLNSVAGASLEIDEGYRLSSSHASISIVPAALAEAEARRASGMDLLLAIILGYEASARAARASKFNRTTQAHAMWSALGASVAVARLRGGDSRRIAAALRFGPSLAFVSTQTQPVHGGTVRNLWAGLGAQAAFVADDISSAGFVSLADALADTYGRASGVAFDPLVFVANLGSEFAVTRNYFKRFACCGHVNAAAEAILTATGGRPIPAADIDSIDVGTYRLAADLSDQSPINPMAARFSLPWCIAAAVVRGDVDVDASSPQALLDDGLRGLAKRVSVRLDPSLPQGFMENRSARVAIRMTDGQLLESYCENAPGDFMLPFSEAQMDAKFLRLAERVLSAPGAAAKVLEASKAVSQAPDVSEFVLLVADQGATDPPRAPLPMSSARTQRGRDYLDDLSEFVVKTTYEDIPRDARRGAKQVLMEDLGAILRGSAQPEVRALTEVVAKRARMHSTTLLGKGFPLVGPLEAAFANGTAASAVVLDASYWLTPAHPGIYAIPAGLAWAEHTAASSQDFLTAMVLGYEVATRMAMATNVVRPMHPHGLFGAVGAGLTVAKLMGLDALGIRETVSLAACLAASNSSTAASEGASIVSAYNGRSCYCGILAATSVRAGYTSPLDGPQLIFGRGVGDRFDGNRVAASLGESYAIAQQDQVAEEELEARLQGLTTGILVDSKSVARMIWDWDAQPTVREFTSRLRELGV